MNHKRSSFSGKLGFVLSAAGASVDWETSGVSRISPRNTEAGSSY